MRSGYCNKDSVRSIGTIGARLGAGYSLVFRVVRQGRYRLLFLVLVILGLWITAWPAGVTGRFTSESIRGLLGGRGFWGVVAFTVLFSAGQLLRVPGTVFVAAAVAVYGRNFGILVALLGALVSVTVSFAVVRAFAGHALA